MTREYSLSRVSLTAVLLAWPVVLVGCLSDPKPPTFKVVDARVTERSAQGVVVTFDIEGVNANKDVLPLDDVTYSLSLDGKQVFSGVRNAQASLPPEGSQRFSVPVPMAVAEGSGAPTGREAYRIGGSVVYKIPGSLAEVFFDSGLRRPSVGFGESGTLDFSGAGSAGK